MGTTSWTVRDCEQTETRNQGQYSTTWPVTRHLLLCCRKETNVGSSTKSDHCRKLKRRRCRRSSFSSTAKVVKTGAVPQQLPQRRRNRNSENSIQSAIDIQSCYAESERIYCHKCRFSPFCCVCPWKSHRQAQASYFSSLLHERFIARQIKNRYYQLSKSLIIFCYQPESAPNREP